MEKRLRFRERHNGSPKEGMRQEWDEWQVVEGRKVIGRYDLRSQALKVHPDAKCEKN